MIHRHKQTETLKSKATYSMYGKLKSKQSWPSKVHFLLTRQTAPEPEPEGLNMQIENAEEKKSTVLQSTIFQSLHVSKCFT